MAETKQKLAHAEDSEFGGDAFEMVFFIGYCLLKQRRLDHSLDYTQSEKR